MVPDRDRLEKFFEIVGRGPSLFVKAGRPVEYDWPMEVKQKLRRLSAGYVWPKFGHNAEIQALLASCANYDKVVDSSPMPTAQRRIVLAFVEEAFRFVRAPPPSDFMTFDHFLRVVEQVDMSASPGLPYMYEHPVNRDWFMTDGALDDAKVQDMWRRVSDRLTSRDFDPIRLFIKPEPIKLAKAMEGRFRVIASVSVVDQLIDQMIFGWQNQLFIDYWSKLPSKVGWAPFVGGWKMVPQRGVLAVDKSSWDWTVQAWMVEDELEIRKRLAEQHSFFVELATWRYKCLYSEALFVTSGGLVLKQRMIGVMKSGCVNTISTNSLLQYLLHVRVSYELDEQPGWLWSMGDDTLQQEPFDVETYLSLLSRYCVVKQALPRPEFAGFRFDLGRIEPMYVEKHAFNLLHMDPENAEQMVDSYALLYNRSQYREKIRSILENTGFRLPDRDLLLVIWDGVE